MKVNAMKNWHKGTLFVSLSAGILYSASMLFLSEPAWAAECTPQRCDQMRGISEHICDMFGFGRLVLFECGGTTWSGQCEIPFNISGTCP